MAQRQTRSLREKWAALPPDQHDLFFIQPEAFRANRAEPEGASPGEESPNAADTRVTPPVWKTPPQRG